MSDARFFKKLVPNNLPRTRNGTVIQFTTLDGVTAYFAADNPDVLVELDLMIREQRYAVSEIGWEEFNREYVEKKSLGIQPVVSSGPWREELSKSGASRNRDVIQRLGSTAVQAAIAVDSTPKAAAAQPVTATDESPPAEPPKQQFKPTLGKRPKRSV